MPIYEFYCSHCHTLFSFFAGAAAAPKRAPVCPRDGKTALERRPSTFAVGNTRAEGDGEDEGPFGDLDDSRMEGALGALASEMERLGESDDPRQIGEAMKRFSEITGLVPGPRVEEAIGRLRAGESLEDIEGDLEAGIEPGAEDDDLSEFFRVGKTARRRARRPHVDKELYFLPD